MADNDTTTGATLGAGAMPGQAGQQQPTTPPPAGATPPAGTTTTPEAEPPATGEDALGDAGKKALDAERDAREQAEKRAKAAEQELEKLRKAGQTEQEKALEAARDEARTEADSRWTGIVRRAQVERALIAAGISQSELALAAAAPDFDSLALSEEGRLEDLTKAVDTFKASHPALFAQAAPRNGSFDTGLGGGRPAGARTYSREELRDPTFYAEHKDDILKAQNEGRITS